MKQQEIKYKGYHQVLIKLVLIFILGINYIATAQISNEYINTILKEAIENKSNDNLDKISKWFRVFNEIDKNHPQYHNVNRQLAKLHYEEKLYEESIKYYKQANLNYEDKNSSYRQEIINYAASLSKTGQLNEAVGVLNKIIRYEEKQQNWHSVINYLHQMVNFHYENNNFEQSLVYNKNILDLLIKHEKSDLDIAKVHNNLGYNYDKLKQYKNAIENYSKAIEKNGSNKDVALFCTLHINTGIAYYHLKDYNNQLKYFEIAKNQGSCNRGQIYLLLSQVYKNKNELYKSLLNAELAEKQFNKEANDELLADSYFILAEIHHKLLNFELAIEYYQKYLKIKENLDSENRRKREQLENLKQTIEKTEKELKLLYTEQRNNQLTISGLKLENEKSELNSKNLRLNTENKEKELILLKKEKQVKETDLNNQLLKNQQIKQELEAQGLIKEKRLQALEIEKKDAKILEDQKEKDILQKDQKINQLEILRSKNIRQNLIIILILLATLLFSIYYFYRNKKKEHQKLSVAYTDLEISEKKVRNAEEKIKILLAQQVSSDVALHLINSNDENLAMETNACILFIDVRNFTPTVKDKKPDEIIKFQNDLFAFMMDTIILHKGIVNTFLGDGFMATFGTPIATENNNLQAFKAVKSIAIQLQQKIDNKELNPIRIGFGLYAGNVIAGNVGSEKRRQFSVNGQPVIMASRLEQLNKTYESCLIMSKDFYETLGLYNHNIRIESTMVKGIENPLEIVILTENELINL